MVMAPDNRLFVAGGFTTIGGNANTYLTPLDPTSGAVLPWANRPPVPTFGAALGPAQLFVATAGVGNNAVIAYDLSTGTQQWSRAADGDVNDVEYMNGIVYAGGHFDTMAGVTHRRLAAFDAPTGALRNDWTPTALDSGPQGVVAMLATSNRLYIGGDFETVSGLTRLLFAMFSQAAGPNNPPVIDSVVIDQASPPHRGHADGDRYGPRRRCEPADVRIPVVSQRDGHPGRHGCDAEPGEPRTTGTKAT